MAVLWIFSLVGISIYGGPVTYGLFWGLTLVPVISALYLIYVYVRFLLYQEVIVKSVVCGQPIPYYFVLQNDDVVTYTGVSVRLFDDFSAVAESPDNREYRLLPGERVRFDTSLTCKYRGEYQIGVKEVILTDLFRLFRVTYKVPSPVKASVIPRVEKLKELRSIADIVAFVSQETASPGEEPESAVRDYIAGDRLRQIHWKSSAREQKLKVRRLLGEEKQGIAVLCDTRRFAEEPVEYLPVENKMLEVLLAVSYYFAAGNTGVTVRYEQQDRERVLRVNGIDGFEALYREVSRMAFDLRGGSSGEMLTGNDSTRLLAGARAVFLIVHVMEDTLFSKAQELSARGTPVVVYVITGRDISEYIRLSSARLRIAAVPPEAGLEGVL